ncbi:hypothetical protein NPX13_g2954 [Xylaria arbuscula]|uniref:C2H2-type domain-containing protein n=1 Tax=Xylaria arbuscula TaxID=114810 RepID=A0A9W8TNP3_9PEZI|nr:hypothetical protein NPX13_g2954 [Xylaria arbuscula]
MDPEIKRSVSPTSTVGSWTVGRYLTDKKSSYILYQTAEPATSTITPFATAHFQRPGSPSYTNSSSTCSSGLSPPREPDYYHIHSPHSPPDMPPLPQFDDDWSTQPQLYEFTGLADACVSLGDVHPMQDIPLSFYDDGAPRFSCPIRTSSMSSENSNQGYRVWPEDEVPQPLRSSSLDTPIIKEEGSIPDAARDHEFQEADTDESRDEPRSPYLKTEPIEDGEVARFDEGDEDYGPRQQSKNEFVKSARTSRTYKRCSSSHSSSDAKRTKTAMEEPLLVRPGPKPSIHGTKGQYNCPDCLKVSFKDRLGLENHIKKQHTRPFTCIFEFAGCRSTCQTNLVHPRDLRMQRADAMMARVTQ